MPASKTHVWTISLLLAMFVFGGTQLGATDGVRSDHPQEYTVQRGDTLWDIAGRFLTRPWLWPEIWQVNPEIRNPHLIYPGDVISLVYVDGEPRLRLDRGEREVRLSPGIREEQLDEAISTIPLSAIRPFLNRSHVVDDAFFDEAPYIIAGEDERVMASAGDRIYIRRLAEDAPVDYAVVRRGNPYIDPDTGELLGIAATYVGDARLRRDGDPATGVVRSSNREVLPGDMLLETPPEAARMQFFPRAPDEEVEGRIIDVMDGVSQIGQFDVVVLNLGKEQGLQDGDVLAMFRAGREISDPVSRERVRLPEERAGELIVFRTFDKLSFGLVMRASRHMEVLDVVRNP